MKHIDDIESGYVCDSDLIGATSSSFTNIRIIHRSAMSITASAERFGHKWFLKSIPPSGSSTISTQRLIKEFEILSSLNHPGIVKAISIGNVENLGLSIVMEWIEGYTLEEMIIDRKIPIRVRQRWAYEIVETVSHIHSLGIAHRDLKLSNIMVRKNGLTPVIVDFGLADTDTHTTLKQAAGTVGYMSPEACLRRDTDTRDDVYSLGVILQKLSVRMPDVVRKCLVPQEKRYANAHSLLLAMKRRHAVGKALRWMALAVVVAAVFGVMGHEIALLQRQRGADLATVELLRDSISEISARASLGEQTITRLNDSISEIQKKVSEAASQQELINRHNDEIDRVVKNGMEIVEAIFRQFNGESVASLRKDGATSSEINNMLIQTMSHSINRYLEGARKSLSSDDFSQVYNCIWNKEVMLYNDWQREVLNHDGDHN